MKYKIPVTFVMDIIDGYVPDNTEGIKKCLIEELSWCINEMDSIHDAIAERIYGSLNSISIDKSTEICIWIEKQDGEEGYWDTGCGNDHIFFGGTPSDNKYKFCPYCGKEIRVEK